MSEDEMPKLSIIAAKINPKNRQQSKMESEKNEGREFVLNKEVSNKKAS